MLEDVKWLEKKTGEDVQERRVTDAGIGSSKLLMERIAECRAYQLEADSAVPSHKGLFWKRVIGGNARQLRAVGGG